MCPHELGAEIAMAAPRDLVTLLPAATGHSGVRLLQRQQVWAAFVTDELKSLLPKQSGC